MIKFCGSNQHTPPHQRFEEKYIPEPNSGCWIWIGGVNWRPRKHGRDAGFPVMDIDGRTWKAYRYSYEVHIGPIPKGKMICHSCGISICVNPDHLYAGTAKENAADMMRHGTHSSQLYPELAKASGRRLYERYGSEMGILASAEKARSARDGKPPRAQLRKAAKAPPSS